MGRFYHFSSKSLENCYWLPRPSCWEILILPHPPLKSMTFLLVVMESFSVYFVEKTKWKWIRNPQIDQTYQQTQTKCTPDWWHSTSTTDCSKWTIRNIWPGRYTQKNKPGRCWSHFKVSTRRISCNSVILSRSWKGLINYIAKYLLNISIQNVKGHGGEPLPPNRESLPFPRAQTVV